MINSHFWDDRNTLVASNGPGDMFEPDDEIEDEHPFPTPDKTIKCWDIQEAGANEMQLVDTYPIEDIVSKVTNEMAIIRGVSEPIYMFREGLSYLEERLDEVKALIRDPLRDDDHIRAINYNLVNLCALAFLIISESES